MTPTYVSCRPSAYRGPHPQCSTRNSVETEAEASIHAIFQQANIQPSNQHLSPSEMQPVLMERPKSPNTTLVEPT